MRGDGAGKEECSWTRIKLTGTKKEKEEAETCSWTLAKEEKKERRKESVASWEGIGLRRKRKKVDVVSRRKKRQCDP